MFSLIHYLYFPLITTKSTYHCLSQVNWNMLTEFFIKNLKNQVIDNRQKQQAKYIHAVLINANTFH